MVDVQKLTKGVLFDGRYRLLKTLSTDGGTADVWLATDTAVVSDGKPCGSDVGPEIVNDTIPSSLVAIKIYRPQNFLDIEGEKRFREEYLIAHNCRHTNLLQPTFYGIYEDTPYLVLQYCKNGSSQLLIGKSMSQKDIMRFIYDVASGLEFLHKCNPPIVHQDIKPANILIDDDNNYAITDFGISSLGDSVDDYGLDGNVGTLAYMAPERFLKKESVEPSSDIWSLGITIYEILMGTVPFDIKDSNFDIREFEKPVKYDKRVPHRIRKIIQSCLIVEPQKRPSAAKLRRITSGHNSSLLYVLLGAILLIGFSILLWPNPKEEKGDVREIYNEAIIGLDRGDSCVAASALVTLDSLASLKYAPAMFVLGKTYGWSADTLELFRKDVLGIDYYRDVDLLGLPIDLSYLDKSKMYFRNITELPDSVAGMYKASAYYWLAAYAANAKHWSSDLEMAKTYLLNAKKYASIYGDTSLLKKIDVAFANVDEQIKKVQRKKKY